MEDPLTHCVVKNVRLLGHIDPSLAGIDNKEQIPAARIYLTDPEKAAGAAYRRTLGNGTVVGVHAGTSVFKGHAKRRWPGEKFASLIDSMPDVRFLLFGTAEDLDANSRIISLVKKTGQAVQVSSATVREAAAIFGGLDAFVTNDSGLMHVAAAMETPVAAILGPTNPAYISPWKVRHNIVRTGIPCSPCFYYSPKPLQCSLDGSFRCLTELPVGDVRHAIECLLSR
jgi:heptosyltransferase-2